MMGRPGKILQNIRNNSLQYIQVKLFKIIPEFRIMWPYFVAKMRIFEWIFSCWKLVLESLMHFVSNRILKAS